MYGHSHIDIEKTERLGYNKRKSIKSISLMLTHYVYEYKCRSKSQADVDALRKQLKDQIYIKRIAKDMLFNECLLNFMSNLKQKEILEILNTIDQSSTMADSLEQIVHYR